MRCVIELLDVESVLLELYYGTLVIIYVAVVRGAEYGDNSGEFLCTVPFMHLVPVKLGLVGT